MSFYAYIHCKPDGTPFYVGKGRKARVKRVSRPHNEEHEKIVGEFGEKEILVGSLECSTEEFAFDLERGLIKRLRRMGVCVVNLTEGGGGVGGFKMPDQAKQKIKKALTGRKFSESHIINLTNSLRGRKMPPLSNHQRKMISLSNSRAKIGNQYTLGRVWITDGLKNQMVSSDFSIPDGWRRGISRKKTK